MEGEVFAFDSDRQDYAHDESILRVEPLCIVRAAGIDDVRVAWEWAHKYQIPLTARGGGTGVAGQSIGEGIILDFSARMNRILEISHDQVRVEPGILLNDLNDELLKLRMRFAPDPSSRARWGEVGRRSRPRQYG